MTEIIATAHALIGFNETALKQLSVMFNRIAIQGLFVDYSRVPFVSPDFVKVRSWLAELGILFDVDMGKLKSSTAHDYAKVRDMIREDTDLFTKPTFGMSSEEMAGAREDEEKAAEIRKRGAEAEKKFADGSIDPLKMMEISLRLSTNTTRMFASQLRDVENVDAYAVIPPEFSSLEQDDPRITNHDVVKITLGALPVPVEDVAWQQLIDYRNDPDPQSSFRVIKDWMSEAARGKLTASQIEETLEYLLNRFRSNLGTHGINTTTTALEAYVVTTPEFLEILSGVGPDFGTRALFSMEHCKIGLLEGESTSAGSEVAFLLSTNLVLPSDGFGTA